MAKTITQLDDAGALQNNNFFEVIQGGLSKKTTFQNLVESIPEASGLQNGLMSIAAHNAATVYKDIPLNGNITESGAYVASFASYMPTSDYYVLHTEFVGIC